MTVPDFSLLPPALAEIAARHWQDIAVTEGAVPETLLADLPVVLAGSDYVASRLGRTPELFTWLADADRLAQPLAESSLRETVAAALAPVTDEAALQQVLRSLRHQHMVRIIWRDLARHGDYHSTVADLSLLAEVLIDGALALLYKWACARDGTPVDAAGNPVQLVVLALGKLGARELNLSSDIDLMFAYEHEGDIQGGRKEQTHHQFFVRLGQHLIRVLDQVTADGFVFRVDMRLRPWGSSGALAAGFDAIESYYEQQGREWERYALIKIRPVAGDRVAGERLLKTLRPFVYRRYIDYGAFESLREMKLLIEREVRRKGIQNNIKLGAGGIRELEFIVQAFQLIRGGQVPVLQQPGLLKVLTLLAQEGLISSSVVSDLEPAYVFLRNLEHRLQAVSDRQTQTLPDNELDWLRIAFSMGFPDRRALEQRLSRYRDKVRHHFHNVIAEQETPDRVAEEEREELSGLWLGDFQDNRAHAVMNQLGIADVEAVAEQLSAFRNSRAVTSMQPISRDRLDRLMPRLLEALGYQQGGRETCERLLRFLDAVLRRSAYIALLVENPHALSQLVKLIAASPWIADQLASHPILLDELLDVSTLYAPPGRQALEDELHQQLLRIPEGDLEQHMEALRHFKQAHLLRVAASEVTEALPLMKVSDYLTWLAEAILVKVVHLAWQPLVQRHGAPLREDGQACDKDFVVLGYGKLGGIELGHNSDLDLVFLHDSAANAMTEGEHPVSNEQFFARLGQRIIHILTARTMSGLLYEVDMRLRPSGAAGLLVSSVSAYSRYQRESAWTWEHQALVRARVVAGCPRTARKFEQIRHEILCQPRETDLLLHDVRTMRARMRDHLGNRDPTLFHLKQDPGGIVDIEFMVQYAVLRWASRFGELTRFTDNVRLLETLAALDLMPAQDAGLLREAYLTYRSAAHRLALRNEKPLVDAGEFLELRDGVCAIRDQWF